MLYKHSRRKLEIDITLSIVSKKRTRKIPKCLEMKEYVFK